MPAAKPVQVKNVSDQQPPILDITQTGPSQLQIGINGLTGQTIILQSAPDLVNWQSLATNTLSAARWIYTDSSSEAVASRFYRATLAN